MEVLGDALRKQVKQNLRILGIVLVPGIMHGLTGARHGQRWDQLQVKTLGMEKMSERPVIVAGASKPIRTGCLKLCR